MALKIRDHFPKFRLPWWGSLLAAVLVSGCITLLALWCQPNALRSVLAVFWHQPLLIVLNALPIGLLVLVGTCLLRNVFFGAALVNLAVCVLSIANRIKIEVRDEPVFPRDFALLKEVGSAMGTYDIQFPWSRHRPGGAVHSGPDRFGPCGGRKALSGAAAPGLAGSATGCRRQLCFAGGADPDGVRLQRPVQLLYRVSNAYYIPSVFNELGFPYCFCHQFTTYPVDRPEGFDRAEAESWDTGGQTGLGKNVNVIMVMNEAFSDISDAPAFAYDESNDPLPNLHALEEDPHAISGHVIVPGFAGGTANTEFDVLTGMQTNALSGDHHLLLPGGEPESGQPVPGFRRRRLRHLLLPPRRRLVLQPGERVPVVWRGKDGLCRPDGRTWRTRAAGSPTTTWRG